MRKVFFILATCLAFPSTAVAQSDPLDITCTGSPLDDWPDQLLITDQRILCRAEGYDITIEVLGLNRTIERHAQDLSAFFRLFELYLEGHSLQPITIHTAQNAENLIEFYMRDGRDQRIVETFRHFVWFRNVRPREPDHLRDTVVVYRASQSFLCGNAWRDIEPGSEEPGALVNCRAARTVTVCDNWHNRFSVRSVQYPVLMVESGGPEASWAMMQGFEPIAQILEDMQTEILTHTCQQN